MSHCGDSELVFHVCETIVKMEISSVCIDLNLQKIALFMLHLQKHNNYNLFQFEIEGIVFKNRV